MNSLEKQNLISFSPDRGYMHIVSDCRKPDTITNGGLRVLANAGAQLMNSPHYWHQYTSPASAEIVKRNEACMRAWMYTFTNPGEVFTHRFANTDHLRVIKRTFENINIPLTTDCCHISGNFPTDGTLMPQVLDPITLSGKGLDHTAKANLNAYYKNQTNRIWDQAGVPTPQTLIINRDNSASQITKWLEKFSQYDQLVINITGGSGGFGLKFVPYVHAVTEIQALLTTFPEENHIMVQGKLPLEASPGIIFAIDDHGVKMLQVADQRFSAPGVFAGNCWFKEIIDTYEDQFPGFTQACLNSAIALQATGVRGQVNVDVLLLSKQTAERFNLPQTVFREANVRSSGSSPIVRFVHNGSIHGQAIARVITNTCHTVSEDDFINFEAPLHPHITAVLYNYAQDGKLSFAIMGTDIVTLDDLHQYEKDTLHCLNAR